MYLAHLEPSLIGALAEGAQPAGAPVPGDHHCRAGTYHRVACAFGRTGDLPRHGRGAATA
jgi:hypothetical protein